MNNTPNNQNEDLNAFSLGNIGNEPNIGLSDIPPVSPVDTQPTQLVDAAIESLDSSPMENMGMNDPIVSSIPPVEPLSTSYDIPQTINQYSTPVFNDIGTVPPIMNNNGGISSPNNNAGPNKKKTNKTTFIIVIILSLVIVASIIYMLLHQGMIKLPSFKKASVTAKEVNIEMGSDVSTDIKDYAIFNNIDSSTCALDVSNITDTNTINAEYTFTVTCNGTKYTGKAKIVDTIPPTVKTKDVTIGVDGSVKPEDFILSCDNDNTACTYEFKDENKVKEHVKTESDYKVDIIVKDASGNATEVVGNLKVSATYAELYLVCSKNVNSYLEKTKIGSVDNMFNKSAIREYIFTYESDTEYNEIKENSKNTDKITIQNITGVPTFNDEAKRIVISKNLTVEELETEMNAKIPEAIGEIKSLYNGAGYDCSFGR